MRSASCSSRRCSRGHWKSDLASGLSRVDGPMKEMYRYRWGIYWVSSNKRHWGMQFYSADIEMFMSGWNTLYIEDFIHRPVRTKLIMPDIPDKSEGTHEKWQTESLKLAGLAARDSKMRQRKMLLFRCWTQWHSICIHRTITRIWHRILTRKAIHPCPLDPFIIIMHCIVLLPDEHH
jgi:hypothetical protein